MTRSKVKLNYITDYATRKNCFKKRKASYFKMLDQITTLCDVEACAIVDSNLDDEATIWPSVDGARKTIEKFRSIPEFEREKREENQESFIRLRMKKVREQLRKQRSENRYKEFTKVMYDSMKEAWSVVPLMMEDDHVEFDRVATQHLWEIQTLMENYKKNGYVEGEGSSSNPIPKIGGVFNNMLPSLPVIPSHPTSYSNAINPSIPDIPNIPDMGFSFPSNGNGINSQMPDMSFFPPSNFPIPDLGFIFPSNGINSQMPNMGIFPNSNGVNSQMPNMGIFPNSNVGNPPMPNMNIFHPSNEVNPPMPNMNIFHPSNELVNTPMPDMNIFHPSNVDNSSMPNMGFFPPSNVDNSLMMPDMGLINSPMPDMEFFPPSNGIDSQMPNMGFFPPSNLMNSAMPGIDFFSLPNEINPPMPEMGSFPPLAAATVTPLPDTDFLSQGMSFSPLPNMGYHHPSPTDSFFSFDIPEQNLDASHFDQNLPRQNNN